MWVPVSGDVRQKILEEAHKFKLSIHPGAKKMYRDLRLSYWWPCMKMEVVWFIEQCLTCRKVKVEHQRTHDKVQPLPIPMWKCGEIIMDFITKFPRTARGVDSI